LRPAESNSQQPVALETAVVATGARPGDSAAKRELFTEETQTVLVFENGAVIRLSAAVADGQLLFLTNKSTGKEVVTQVLRKRSFRPTNCYVDLEFTEPCPDFWGIEFSKSAVPAVPASASKTSADAEESPITLAKPATPPSLQEVERLKQEVSQLQTQLKSFTQSAPAEGAAAADPLAVPTATKVAGKIGAEVARKEEEKQLEELFALEAKQEAAHPQKRLVAYPKKSGTRVSQRIASKKWLVAATLAAVLCLTLAYDFGAFGSSPITPAAPKSAKTLSAASRPVPLKPTAIENGLTASHDVLKTPAAMAPVATNIPTAKSSPVIATENKSEKAVSSFPANLGREIPSAAIPKTAVAANPLNSRRTADKPSETPPTKVSASVGTSKIAAAANNSAPSSSAPLNTDATTATSTSEGGSFTLPKLLHAVKPVAPPEALKSYVTGTVNVDALVDTNGHIKSVTVLSGPTKLRQHAIEEMKQYVYEPAKRNGIAVSSHVQVSLQYWYEP
jgi:hypothetical protein